MPVTNRLVAVCEEPDLSRARDLFTEYQTDIGVDLCFQGFPEELKTLPGNYAPPRGRLYLAVRGEEPAGCVALRPLGESDCEMKRLYVRPAFRGTGVGRLLAERVVQDARELGYERMLLDTLPAMTGAVALYRSLGFVEIAPYRFNPLEGATYMALELKGR